MRALQVNDTAIAVQVKGIVNDAGKSNAGHCR